MKRLMVLLLLLTSCSFDTSTRESISAFAPCGTIQTTGAAADGVMLQCLDGDGELAIEAIEGPALISVWASWCSNCEKQRPYLIRAFNESRDRFQIIGVDVEEKSKEVGHKHALARGMAYPQLFDPDGRSSKVFGPGVPITQFINENQKLVFQQIGAFSSYNDLVEKIYKYLGVEIS